MAIPDPIKAKRSDLVEAIIELEYHYDSQTHAGLNRLIDYSSWEPETKKILKDKRSIANKKLLIIKLLVYGGEYDDREWAGITPIDK